eukprot:COSAG05_NODE_49_length_24373_cov_16.162561_40_plen_41_part_01
MAEGRATSMDARCGGGESHIAARIFAAYCGCSISIATTTKI